MAANTSTQAPESGGSPTTPVVAVRHRWHFDRYVFDPERRELTVDGRRRHLEDRQVALLHCLLERADQVVDRDTLRGHAWRNQVVTDGAIAKAVMKLRAALGNDAERLLLTVHGIGYRLAAQATRDQVDDQVEALHLAPGAPLPQRANWFVVDQRGQDSAGERWHIRHSKTGEFRLLQTAFNPAQQAVLRARLLAHRRLQHALPWRRDLARLIEANEHGQPALAEFSLPSAIRLDDPDVLAVLPQLSAQQRLNLALAVVQVLAATHAIGIGHGELGPEHLYLDRLPDPVSVCADPFQSSPGFLPLIQVLGLREVNTDDVDETEHRAPAPIGEDVRRLGLLLYQLQVGDLDAQIAPGWERRIDDPVLREDIAAACNDDPALRPRDAGDLAAALRALPARRRQRAENDAAQAQLARQRQTLARVRQRRRWALALLAGMSVFAVTSLTLLQQARHARDQAREAQASAQAINRFLIHDLIRQAEPFYGSGADLRLVDVLAPAEAGIQARFGNQPEVAAEITRALAQIRLGLGEWDRAEALLVSSLELAGERWPANHPQRAATQFEIGDLLVRRAQFEQARTLYREVLATQLAHFGAAHVEPLWTRTQLAWLEHELGASAEAAVALADVLDAAQRLSEPDPALVDLSEHYLALVETELGLWSQAEVRFQALHTRVANWRGAEHAATAQVARNLGRLWIDMGRPDAAVKILQPALATMSQRLDPDHPESLALKAELGTALLELGEHDRALSLLQEAGDGRRRLLGIEHNRTRHTLSRLAQALDATGDIDAALALATEVRSASETHLGTAHPESALFRHRHAQLLARHGDIEAAIDAATSALPDTEQRYGAEHPRSLAMRLDLIEWHLAIGDVDSARTHQHALPSSALDELPEAHPIRRSADRIAAMVPTRAVHGDMEESQ